MIKNRVAKLGPAIVTALLWSCAPRDTGPIDIDVDIPIFPPENYWNADISALPVHPNSTEFINSIGANQPLHPDFGTVYEGAPNGIPFVVVDGGQEKVAVDFEYADESDPGPYPIPRNAPIEGGDRSTGDRHVIVIDRANLILYELYAAYPRTNGSWSAGSGAIWNLREPNPTRKAGWTSADAAGLPIFPGLARFDEAASGVIPHALRFTANSTRRAFIPPASHWASDHTGADLPPMGLRLRLKADFDFTDFSPMNQAILAALKRYGMILADNGSDWFISGAPDDRWNDEDLHELSEVRGSDFEAVYTGETVTSLE
jgi:hypothetical protein